MNPNFFLAIGVALIMTFGMLAAFHGGGQTFNSKATAIQKELVLQMQE